jgi:uncharacterized LabA/DUF88 family protein
MMALTQIHPPTELRRTRHSPYAWLLDRARENPLHRSDVLLDFSSKEQPLATVPEISVHMGMFLSSEKFAGLIHPPEFRPVANLPRPWPDVVKVLKVEEKGSDVNLACHLLLDAFQGNFDVAAVLSNDSDLVEPIRIVTQVLGKPVGLLSPVNNPNPELSRASRFIRRLSVSDLAASQFPDPLPRPGQPDLAKPTTWA